DPAQEPRGLLGIPPRERLPGHLGQRRCEPPPAFGNDRRLRAAPDLRPRPFGAPGVARLAGIGALQDFPEDEGGLPVTRGFRGFIPSFPRVATSSTSFPALDAFRRHSGLPSPRRKERSIGGVVPPRSSDPARTFCADTPICPPRSAAGR